MPAAVPISSPGGNRKEAKRVTVWNRETKRKISGNAAPMEKNLQDYLRRHPGKSFARLMSTHWSKEEAHVDSAIVTPEYIHSSSFLLSYKPLSTECELYNGQDQQLDPAEKAALIAAQNRIAIWNRAERWLLRWTKLLVDQSLDFVF